VSPPTRTQVTDLEEVRILQKGGYRLQLEERIAAVWAEPDSRPLL